MKSTTTYKRLNLNNGEFSNLFHLVGTEKTSHSPFMNSLFENRELTLKEAFDKAVEYCEAYDAEVDAEQAGLPANQGSFDHDHVTYSTNSGRKVKIYEDKILIERRSQKFNDFSHLLLGLVLTEAPSTKEGKIEALYSENIVASWDYIV